MKRKKLAIFIALTVSLAIILSGCQASTKKVSVGNMSLDIPSDWQKKQIEEPIDADDDMAPYWCVDVYGPEVGNEIYSLSVICEDIKGYHKSFGSPYSYEPDSDYYWGYLKEEYVIASFGLLYRSYMSTGQLQSTGEPVTLKIYECEAVETKHIFTLENVSYVANVLTIFSENDLGTLMLVRREATEQYKGQYDWGVIRDSLRFK